MGERAVIRAATESDLGPIVELMNLGRVEGTEARETPRDLEPYRRALREVEGEPGGVLVAEQAGEVVGVCQLIVFRHLQERGGLCAEIESVYVRPDSRGQGIGALLMEAVIERARALGCYRVQLTSKQVRLDAHRFYERLDFEPAWVGFKLALDPEEID